MSLDQWNPPRIKITTDRSKITKSNRGHVMYGRYEHTDADRKADDTRSVSIIILPADDTTTAPLATDDPHVASRIIGDPTLVKAQRACPRRAWSQQGPRHRTRKLRKEEGVDKLLLLTVRQIRLVLVQEVRG